MLSEWVDVVVYITWLYVYSAAFIRKSRVESKAALQLIPERQYIHF